ncbi:hypothetical protein ACFO4P_17150 [Epilithonimonas pallida]|uniref:Uncharacterized protein n=1 Tax=Epilithonimonas pallida TaxID=373671 RepID=A0ABY1R409_9FLAO|nr:hypothetical protein [Epilithonimonas pallida]SMP94717.1 hypothetical protein SAMN05421679_106116 [Epilithonimonas pallida]
MSNKKRIRKEISKPYEAKFRRASATIAALIIEKAFLKAQLAIVVAQKAKSYPSGGIRNEKNSESILDSSGIFKIVPIINPGWNEMVRFKSEADKRIIDAMSIPLKSLEGMLSLERQNDGSVKTVFAGKRDCQGSKTETRNS